MGTNYLTIGFVRRGYSSSGGAEAYLQRLAAGVVAKGHSVRLYTSTDWPANEWSFGPITHVEGRTNIAFADGIEKLDPRSECDILMSLERIWKCDVYRAGDGVHRAWLERRAEMGGPFRRLGHVLNRKHAATLGLEASLLAEGGASWVIANSKMVKDEIVRFHGFPPDKISVVPNGVPVAPFQQSDEQRARTREQLGLTGDEISVLFAGSGWERKGLRFAIEAIERRGKQFSLLVAGRGDADKFASARVRFLGVVQDMPAVLAAADIFLLPTIYDPFSNACLEALAAGLPIVTTRANGFSEIIEQGIHGSVVDDPRNADAINEALLFWSDRARREQTRIPNRALAAQFDISTNVARTLEILTSYCAE